MIRKQPQYIPFLEKDLTPNSKEKDTTKSTLYLIYLITSFKKLENNRHKTKTYRINFSRKG